MKKATLIGYILAAVFAAGFVYQTMQVNKLKTILDVNVQALQNKIQSIEPKSGKQTTNSFMDTKTVVPVEVESPVKHIKADAEYKLEGREVETKELPESDVPGVIVVGISVDQNGNVVKTTIGATSTIKDKEIQEAAKEAAMKTRFSATEDSAAKTVGNITYTFSQD